MILHSLLAWVQEEEKTRNIHIEKENESIIILKHLQLKKTSSNLQYIIHNFRIDSQQRVDIFEYFSLYEFFSKVKRINNIHCHQFHRDHLRYNTHILYEYKISKIPIIQNYMIPS
jgi:hypothetical protein